MVGVRFLPIFIFCFLLFSGPVYALRPSSTDEIEEIGKEETMLPGEVERQAEVIKQEKKKLMEDAAPLREERSRNLRPFVSSVSSAAEAAPALPYAVKGFIPAASNREVLRERQPAGQGGQGLVSKPVPNLIFFSVIIIAFLGVYYFIRPRPK